MQRAVFDSRRQRCQPAGGHPGAACGVVHLLTQVELRRCWHGHCPRVTGLRWPGKTTRSGRPRSDPAGWLLCDQAYLTVAPDQLADNPGKTLVGLLAAAERAKHQTDSSRRAGATNRASSSRLRVVSTAAAVCGISVTPARRSRTARRWPATPPGCWAASSVWSRRQCPSCSHNKVSSDSAVSGTRCLPERHALGCTETGFRPPLAATSTGSYRECLRHC